MSSPNSSPLKFLPSKKRRLLTDWQKCIICQQIKPEQLSTASTTGIETILTTAKAIQDIVWQRLEPDENILCESNSLALHYHRTCYQKFTSKRNLVFAQKRKEPMELDTSFAQNNETVQTREKTHKLTDWSKCFICHANKNRKHKLHKVQTFACQDSILQAASRCGDTSMLGLLEGEELIAVEAVYHGSCLATYTRKANSSSGNLTETSDAKVHHNAFQHFVQEFDGDLEKGKAYTLKQLLGKYQKHLKAEGVKEVESYTTQKLQRRIERHYGDKITIQSQRGQSQSSIILSSRVSLGDAVKACAQLKSNKLDLGIIEPVPSGSSDRYAVIHTAVSYLREEIASIPATDEYFNPNEVDMNSAEKFVPPYLRNMILWMLSTEAFNTADPEFKASEKVQRRILSIGQSLIYCSRNKVMPPLHLGLAAQLHHDHGKREIIDVLNSHGFCISYDQLRCFITDLSKDELQRIQANTYVPGGLTPKSDGGLLIQEGDDNIDINCETIDGKGTFHSMARVVFQEQPSGTRKAMSDSRIKIGQERSLPLNPENVTSLKNVLYFEKPKERPEPPRIHNARATLKCLATDRTHVEIADLSWVLLRMIQRPALLLPPLFDSNKSQSIPFWTGYNASVSQKHESSTVAVYAPIVDAKPSDPSTVYTTMTKCRAMTQKLGQESAVQTMDQQLYAVAQFVKWTKAEEFGGHVVRLGGFHTVCCFISTIGKIWGDGGLRDLLVDSGVYAANTVEQMLVGKQFHRAVRGLTLAFEVIMQLLITEFLKWCGNDQVRNISENVWNHVEVTLAAFQEGSSQQKANAVKELKELVSRHVEPKLKQFRSQIIEESPTAKYWCMFLDAVQLMLCSIRAEREGDWNLHLSSHVEMIPYFFATDHCNYARWTPVYLLDMKQLPDIVQQAFDKGQFAIRGTPGAFNGIWSDMGTESTVIRDAKSDGGVVGLTRKESALLRWTLTRGMLGEYARTMKIYSGLSPNDNEHGHEQVQAACMKRDEEHVQQLVCHVETNMTHPFDCDNHPEGKLLHIGSGVIASAQIQKSLLTAIESGKSKMEKFVEDTMGQSGTKSFYSPISRGNIKTFSDLNTKTKVVLQGKKKLLRISAEVVFRRGLKIAQVRQDASLLQHIISHPITAIPTALFHDDGSMRKTAKAELTHVLEELVSQSDEEECLHTDVYIRDSMAELYSLTSQSQTFGDLAQKYTTILLKCTTKAQVVIDVFDQYNNENSVKAEERNRRQDMAAGAREYQVIAGRKLPPWNKFMALSQNKTALTNFICQFICEHAPAAPELVSNPERKIYLAGGFTDGEITVCVSAAGSEPVPELFSDHEEADTRMLFHAVQADKEFVNAGVKGNVKIKSSDTDVLVLAVYYFPKLHNTTKLWIEKGKVTATADLRKQLPVHEICSQLSDNVKATLPAIHALTGCDSNSAMYGFGKKKVWKAVMAAGNSISQLENLGSPNSTESAINASRTFVSSLYDPAGRYKESHCDLAKLREELIGRDTPLQKIPPSEPGFEQHVKRACYQTRIWMNSHYAKPDIGSPDKHGWHKEGDVWKPTFFCGQSAAELLEELLCSCRGKTPCRQNCTCSKNGLPCTEECICRGNSEECHNEISSQLDEDQ